jgi:hypothetical protein
VDSDRCDFNSDRSPWPHNSSTDDRAFLTLAEINSLRQEHSWPISVTDRNICKYNSSKRFDSAYRWPSKHDRQFYRNVIPSIRTAHIPTGNKTHVTSDAEHHITHTDRFVDETRVGLRRDTHDIHRTRLLRISYRIREANVRMSNAESTYKRKRIFSVRGSQSLSCLSGGERTGVLMRSEFNRWARDACSWHDQLGPLHVADWCGGRTCHTSTMPAQGDDIHEWRHTASPIVS